MDAAAAVAGKVLHAWVEMLREARNLDELETVALQAPELVRAHNDFGRAYKRKLDEIRRKGAA